MANWLFQESPDQFHRDRAPGSDERDRPRQFNVARYHQLLSPGDNAAIWVSGRDSGVYGLATIAPNPAGDADIYDRRIQPDNDWLPGSKRKRVVPTVNFGSDARWLQKPIPRSILKADPRFVDAPILRAPFQANPFPLTDKQWQAITSRVEGL